ncbi:MAG: hypothetical protein ACLPV8_04135 [Steroidobacteraceae bacterium]
MSTRATFRGADVRAIHAELARQTATPATEAVTPKIKEVTIIAVSTGFRHSLCKIASKLRAALVHMATFSLS